MITDRREGETKGNKRNSTVIPVVTQSKILKFGQIRGATASNPAWNSFLNSSARFLSGLRQLFSSLQQSGEMS